MNDLKSDLRAVEPLASVQTPHTVAEAIAYGLRELGVVRACGVSGGAQALLWAALSKHLDVLHFRHESGAAFAATEAYFAGDRPVAVFATTGPGITNALTGVLAARTEGAKIIFLSAYGSAAHRGRGGIQETSSHTMPGGGLFEAGAWFDDAVVLESPDQLPQTLRRIAAGLRRPGGYVAHVSVPNAIQGAVLSQPMPSIAQASDGDASLRPGPNATAVARCMDLLSPQPFAIWVGFGARGAAAELLAFAERTGAPVMCSPRAKGLFPEDHPLFLGVTGMGGHTSAIAAYMRSDRAPHRILVLGTRLGEPTSFWSPALVPAGGFVHVDVDPAVPGVAYPRADTFPVQAEARDFLLALMGNWRAPALPRHSPLPRPELPHPEQGGSGLVRPDALMAAVQSVIVDGSDAVVLAESGNSFTWATHFLRFASPGRYRVSTNLGSMGHAATGVLGAALGRNGRAVAIVGDGAMLMNSGEVSTAVKRGLPATWIVLNDGRYNMCYQGMAALGMSGFADATFPQTDFAMLGRAMGAQGARVDSEGALTEALAAAISSPGPFVLDVLIDADRLAPAQGRNEGLRAAQAARSDHAGMSFPVVAA